MAVTVSTYEIFLQELGLGNINLRTGDFRVALVCAAASKAGTNILAASTWGSLSGNEITNQTTAYAGSGSPYADDGVTLDPTWVSFGTTSFRFDFSGDVTWSASADMSAHAAIVYVSDSSGGKTPCFHIDFGGSAKAGAGTNFIIQWPASGLFELTAT